MQLERLSFGVGDRFAHQAAAQLTAFERLAERGVIAVPVWNKSNREHTFIGSEPRSVWEAARAAVADRGWRHGWHVDADHIRLETVERFLPWSDFFTIDVADSIGQPVAEADVAAFLERHAELRSPVAVAGLAEPVRMSAETLRPIVAKYLLATREAGRIFRRIAEAKGGPDGFIADASMDETDAPQTPPELLVILALLADEGVRAQTIAPKFTGRFNKGVDYVGDLVQFEQEFNDDLAVIANDVLAYGMPPNLKMSVHSGSDKFSLYPIIGRALRRTGAGLHLKTAGTTWLEELIGLSEAGGAGLELAKEIYAYAYAHVDEFCAPYASVIDIRRDKLPSVADVNGWSGSELADALRHLPSHPRFNPHVRQLLHVSFKVAAKHGERYLAMLRSNAAVVGRNVAENLFDRHMAPLFLS